MRKLDDIVPPSRRREGEPPNKVVLNERGPRFPFTTIAVVVLVIAASIAALFYFSSAKVEVTPTAVNAAVQASFTAKQSTGELPFEIISAQKIASQSVEGSGSKTVNTSASGPITIYNSGPKPQKLIATTRFATPAGLIFRIKTAVTVPAGTSTKPGSTQVTIYADKPGPSYNVAPTSFTVPGLAGTPQASQVYGRSTVAMTGGASGTVPVVDTATEASAKVALTAALAPDLAQGIQEKVPAGYELIPGASVTSYEQLASSPSSSTGMVDIKVQGTVTAVVFPNAALAKAVGSSVAGMNYQGEPLTIASINDLSLTSANGLPNGDNPEFTFTLGGTAPLVYDVDSSRIAAAIAGKTRPAAEVALTNYPEVKRAIIVLRPFWKRAFPEDPASIAVVVAKP